MLTESELRSRVRAALEAVTPPAPWLETNIKRSAATAQQSGRASRPLRGPRVSMRLAAIPALIALLLGVTATLLAVRHALPPPVPASPKARPHVVAWAHGSIDMLSPTVGWAYGSPPSRTADGGRHWTNVAPHGASGDRAGIAFVIDETRAWVTDWRPSADPKTPGGDVVIYRTSDGGQTWQQGVPITVEWTAGATVYFLDPTHGWMLLMTATVTGNPAIVIGDNLSNFSDRLYRTVDGGIHWELEAVNPAPEGWNGSKLKASCFQWCQSVFTTPNIGWIASGSDPQAEQQLFTTKDAGLTWHIVPLALIANQVGGTTSPTLLCPCLVTPPTFVDQLHGMLVLTGTQPNFTAQRSVLLLVTADGGATWSARALPDGTRFDVGFSDATHGWAVDRSAAPSPTLPTVDLVFYRTDDGGQTWTREQTDLQPQSRNTRIISLYFIDRDVGFAVQTTVVPPDCDASKVPNNCTDVWALLETVNGGHTWRIINSKL